MTIFSCVNAQFTEDSIYHDNSDGLNKTVVIDAMEINKFHKLQRDSYPELNQDSLYRSLYIQKTYIDTNAKSAVKPAVNTHQQNPSSTIQPSKDSDENKLSSKKESPKIDELDKKQNTVAKINHASSKAITKEKSDSKTIKHSNHSGFKKQIETAYAKADPTIPVVFTIQIAASRSPLDKTTLSKLYGNSTEIKEYIDEGWYKYRIPGGENYNETHTLKRKYKLNKAFVVALQNEKKINIKDAISLTK